MTLLEQEIIQKFYQLDHAAQERVRHIIAPESSLTEPIDSTPFDYEAWFAEMEVLRQDIKTMHGGIMPSMDIVGILRDIRDGDDE